MFRKAFFVVVIPWMSITIREVNEYREKRFIKIWVEERFMWALEEKVPMPRWDILNDTNDEIMIPVSLAWYSYRVPGRLPSVAWSFTFWQDFTYIYHQDSSPVFERFYWWSQRYKCPRLAISRWLYDMHTWYYTGRWHTPRGVEYIDEYPELSQ